MYLAHHTGGETLGLMLGATLVFMHLIVFNIAWANRVMRSEVTVAHIRANEHYVC